MGLFDWMTGGVNKRADALSQALPKYEGYRPPHVTNLRGVEDQIQRILQERSQGQGLVGYDPKRREDLLQSYDIQQKRDQEKTNSDLQNRISGMGLSRSPAVYDELMGRSNRDYADNKSLYTKGVDVEDLAQRNADTTHATDQLQNLNSFNFGQENAVADFDLNAFGQESSNEINRRGIALKTEDYRESPFSLALKTAGAVSNFVPGASGSGTNGAPQGSAWSPPQVQSAGAYSKPNSTYGGGDQGQGAFTNYLKQLSLKSGKNLYQ